MQRLIQTLLLLCMLVATNVTVAASTDPLLDIGALAEQHEVIRAEFKQTKQMAALRRPLVTTGELVYSRPHGVYWKIERPFAIAYILGEQSIIEIDGNGPRKVRGMREVPGLSQVGAVFRSLLGADTTALRNHFDVRMEGDKSRWKVLLTPRQSQMKQFLAGLELSGGRFVETLRIDEANGDKTDIVFQNTRSEPPLQDFELARFGASGATHSSR